MTYTKLKNIYIFDVIWHLELKYTFRMKINNITLLIFSSCLKNSC